MLVFFFKTEIDDEFQLQRTKKGKSSDKSGIDKIYKIICYTCIIFQLNTFFLLKAVVTGS